MMPSLSASYRTRLLNYTGSQRLQERKSVYSANHCQIWSLNPICKRTFSMMGNTEQTLPLCSFHRIEKNSMHLKVMMYTHCTLKNLRFLDGSFWPYSSIKKYTSIEVESSLKPLVNQKWSSIRLFWIILSSTIILGVWWLI